MPEYICKPVFHSINKKYELFGQDYFDGVPIDACYEDNKISINDVNKVITKIKKLGELKEISSTSNLLEEFDGLMENIKKLIC